MKETVMTRTAQSAPFGVATAITGLVVFVGAIPSGIAHADQQQTRDYVNNVRGTTTCPGLTARSDLDSIAQQYATTEKPPQAGGYPGTVVGFLGSGDPFAKADDSAMAKAKSALANCNYTDFGVGFIRHDDRSVDVVTIVLGQSTKPSVAPPQNQQPGPGLGVAADSVIQARSQSHCPALTYRTSLENEAQQYARTENAALRAGEVGFLGSGDPIIKAIQSATSKANPAIADCSNTTFGVGFVRHDDRSVDVVTVVLAKQ
ncbi:hypothetical protein A9X04_19800 [Mycobacterium sp. E3247]|nr:hypothetical protein A9X04_19800 [Mycobacterium sp. E3247]